MGDFWQGEIPTFQRLVTGRERSLAASLEPAAGARRVTLLLPCHARELGTEALTEMLVVLRGMPWLHRVVIGLDQASAEEHAWLCGQTAGLAEVLWLDGPAWAARLARLPPDAPASGKGRNVWLSLGYVLESPETEVIALHDCDLQPYASELLERLVYPVARAEFGKDFAKGYYARYAERLHGRLTRLLFQPLVQALQARFPAEAVLKFLRAFRYPLAGEVAMTADVARRLPLHAGWGLETAMLAELPQFLPPDQLCQVDLCERYDHRHRPLETGLREPAQEVAQVLLTLVREWPTGFDVVAAYRQHAEAAQEHFRQLARLNGLETADDDENAAVALFTAALQAAVQTRRAPLPMLPAWQSLQREPH